MRHWLFAALLAILFSSMTEPAAAQRLRRRAPAPLPTPVPLFDGQSLAGWVTAKGEPVTAGWEVVDGMLHLKERSTSIYSEREYINFILDFEWKITDGGNSGVKYRIRSYGNALLGIEYQLLDDLKYKYQSDHIGSTGSIYALYEPRADKPLNPVGEFNHSRIVVQGNRLEHWLNGVQIASAIVGSREWYQRVAASKFGKRSGFAENASGKLMLQDHGHPTWFRSITIQELAPTRSRRLSGLLRR
ncbi:MAG: DUF1080 domain-containing protein [Pirellulaceae bacterium]